MSAYDERQALAGLQNLDSQTIVCISIDQYFTEVYRYVRYRLNDDTAAEDIAGDLFMRAGSKPCKRNRDRQVQDLKGWLIAAASNAVNDHLRRRYRRPVEALSNPCRMEHRE